MAFFYVSENQVSSLNPLGWRVFQKKPTAQAAGADPSRWSSTNRQNPPIQQNRRLFMIKSTICNREGLTAPYRYFHKPSLNEWINELMREVILEQPWFCPSLLNIVYNGDYLFKQIKFVSLNLIKFNCLRSYHPWQLTLSNLI